MNKKKYLEPSNHNLESYHLKIRDKDMVLFNITR